MDRILSVMGEFISVLNAVSPNALIFVALITVFLALVVLLIKL